MALDVDIEVLVFVVHLVGTLDQVDAGPAEAFGSSHLGYVSCLVKCRTYLLPIPKQGLTLNWIIMCSVPWASMVTVELCSLSIYALTLPKICRDLRDRPRPLPLIPCLLAKRLNLLTLAQQLDQTGVCANTVDSAIEVRRLAVGREHL